MLTLLPRRQESSISISGVTLTATGALPGAGCGLVAQGSGTLVIGPAVVFGACAAAPVYAAGGWYNSGHRADAQIYGKRSILFAFVPTGS